MDQVSAGTQHFFARIGGWLQALQNGALLVVDEIEDSLHLLLTRRLIEMVQDQAVSVLSESIDRNQKLVIFERIELISEVTM